MSARIHLPSGLVTFLFTDIENSTRLAQLLGTGYRPVLNQHRRLLRRAFRAHGGVALFTEGDSFFFVFPDATAALAACRIGQRSLDTHRWQDPRLPPKVRMGLHSGWAQPQGGEYASAEVHRAARIAAAAHGGQVLCSAATAHQAAGMPADARLLDLGLFRLRGFDAHERLFQLVAPELEQDFPRPRTDQVAPHNLPTALTSFVGRDREQIRLAELLAEHKVVTVVGTGGAGKTRLATQVAAAQVDAYPDGVWFVDIAAVSDAGLVAVTVAGVLGLRPEPGRPVVDTLADYAGGRRLLLVLDTCDAQIGAVAPVVARLLAGGGEVSVLATSRQPIGLPGELVWRIPPLSSQPEPDGGPGDAVTLLAQRTAAARGGRAPLDSELPQLARIAARLDGLPLAIELAAARLRVLAAPQLAGRLDAGRLAAGFADGLADVLATLDAGRVDTPAADRHATLQATVGWSYRTLEPEPARLLRVLSVFAAPVQLATAEWLLDHDPLDALTVLVDKSLLHVEPTTTGVNYRMLDPIRSYAARALHAAGEEAAARDRHVAWSLHALHRARLGRDGEPTTLSLGRLDPLVDEVRTALHWSVTGGTAGSGLRLAHGLEQWWRERGLAREGRLWLSRLYGRIAQTGEAVDDAQLATAYHVHSLHAGADGEYGEQLRYSREAEVAARRCGDPGLLARVLAGRGWSLLDLGQPLEAERSCRELIGWAEQQDVAADALFAVYCLAQLLWRRGALDEAAELLGGARQVEAARPEVRGRRTVDMLLGMVALARHDLVAAHDHLVVALRSRMEYGFHSRACESLGAVAARCALADDLATAALLFGAMQAARVRLRAASVYGSYLTEQENAVRAALGDARFDAAYAQGSALTLAAAADRALAVAHPDLTPEHDPAAGNRRPAMRG